MEYLNLHTQFLDSESFVGSEPVDRATWLCLLRYCVGQENGGRIEACRSWGDRRWQQLCRIRECEVLRQCALWSWQGDGIIVQGYPVDQEARFKANRENGRAGGIASGKARTKGAEHKTNRSETEAPVQSRFNLASTEQRSETGARGERKEKERKGTETAGAPPCAPESKTEGSGSSIGLKKAFQDANRKALNHG